MPDEPALDVISGGRDPGPRRAGPWRLLAGVAVAVLIAGATAFRLLAGPSGPVPPRKPQASPSPLALTAPSMLHGTPLRPGGALGALLFLGGEELRLLTVGERAPLTSAVLTAGDARNPLGPDPALTRVPGAPIPVATLPAVLGAFPAGSSDVVCARWSADGSGLWIVATDGLFFQVGYWTGHGPVRVLQPQTGLAYKLGVPGPAA
jgi:hypothetical protein